MLQLIPPQQLISLLEVFSPWFTKPGFRYFCDFVVAMIACAHRLTATTAYRISDRMKHYTNYSRFLSEYRWLPQEVSQRLLDLVVERIGLKCDAQGRPRLYVILDETIVEKTSKYMFGVAWQPNTHGGWCRGTHILGHYWLMMGIWVELNGYALCIPLGFRLYRQKKRCPEHEYKTTCELGMELLQSLQWPKAPGIIRTVIADAGFADHKLVNWCKQHGFEVIVRGRMDAQVHDLYVQQPCPLRGRPRKWGEKISLQEVAKDQSNFKHTVELYQERTPTRLASVVGRHRASGLPMRFVISRCQHKDDLVIMSTDLSLTPREIASLYAGRFSIELTFRELKQHFGLGHYQVRRPEAMMRHVHLSAVACALTQILTLDPPKDGFRDGMLQWKPMPWRKSDTRISVYETQFLLRCACELEGTFCLVAQPAPHGEKPQIPVLTASRHPPSPKRRPSKVLN